MNVRGLHVDITKFKLFECRSESSFLSVRKVKLWFDVELVRNNVWLQNDFPALVTSVAGWWVVLICNS